MVLAAAVGGMLMTGVAAAADLEVLQTPDIGARKSSRIARYWTPSRMAAAPSLDLMAAPIGSREGRAGVRPPESEANATVHAWASVRPGETALHQQFSRGAVRGGDPNAGNGTPPSFLPVLNAPFVYTRYRLFPDTAGDRTAAPWRQVGKLFFTIPGQGNFQCSASAIASDNHATVWTAGHCVYSPGIGFHSNFQFIPAYHAHLLGPTETPYGVWTYRTAVILSAWTGGLLEYDHGALVMNKNAAGQALTDVVGGLGFITHYPRYQNWSLLGFPAGQQSPPSPGPLFDGGHVEICNATWATDDLPTGGPFDPPTMGVGCDQTGGTSGGPWVVDLSGTPGFTNLLNGNNSYRYVGCAPTDFCNLELYGPYFGDGAYLLKIFTEAIFLP
jgi:hypothetical protein